MALAATASTSILRLEHPMTPSHLDGDDPWLATLEGRAAELAEHLQSTLDESRESAASLGHQDVPDDVDVAEVRLRTALRHAERERDVEELREVEAARSRLAAGVFGLCTECGVEIELQRLQARPACARCMDCQVRHERMHPTRIQIPRSL
jgi:RNA polymerase-binding protein DksA